MPDAPILGESVYLAGSITGLTYDQSMGWRRTTIEVLANMGYDVFSPMRHKLDLAHKFGDKAIPHTDPSFRDPFNRDVHDIRRADYVLCFDPYGHSFGRDMPSVGTLVELGIAYEARKYIIVVEPSLVDNLQGTVYDVHPFIAGVANDLVPSLNDAYTLLREYRALQPSAY